MKKAVKIMTSVLVLVGMMAVCGTTTSCKSHENMYTAKKKTSKVINRHYRVRGTNQKNSSTYRTY